MELFSCTRGTDPVDFLNLLQLHPIPSQKFSPSTVFLHVISREELGTRIRNYVSVSRMTSYNYQLTYTVEPLYYKPPNSINLYIKDTILCPSAVLYCTKYL